MWNYYKGIDAKNKRISSHLQVLRCNEFESLALGNTFQNPMIIPSQNGLNLVGEITLLLWFSYHLNYSNSLCSGSSHPTEDQFLIQQIQIEPTCLSNSRAPPDVFKTKKHFSLSLYRIFNEESNQKVKVPIRCARHKALRTDSIFNGLIFKLKLPSWIPALADRTVCHSNLEIF